MDGIQLVRVSLQRRNGRRSTTIPKIIKEYNDRSGTDPITLITAPGMTQEITCFKITQSNPILLRIDMDRSSSRFWSWDAPIKSAQHGGTKKNVSSIHSGLEGLVRELNLDPTTLCMQSAYDQVAKAYFQIKGVELKNSGTFPAKDKDFILAELRRHFDKERMFTVAPASNEPLNAAAKAITDVNFMGDIQFKKDESKAQNPTLNETAVRFLTHVVTQRSGQRIVQMTLKEIVNEFNRESAGIYRSTCVLPFLQPFIDEGMVVSVNSQTLRMDLIRIAERLKL